MDLARPGTPTLAPEWGLQNKGAGARRPGEEVCRGQKPA